jgi:CheY-like chemotaxis protein
MGHSVVVAANGQKALQAFATEAFDLVLMDVQMPEMDGFAATAAIRAQEQTGSHIAIIAMTAHAVKGDRERCLNAGMDDYISKPISQQDLKAAIQRNPLAPDKAKAATT